jgi:hypothetical protein
MTTVDDGILTGGKQIAAIVPYLSQSTINRTKGIVLN